MTAPRPWSIVAELTHRCPLACAYCSNPLRLARRGDELDAAEWGRALAGAAELGAVQCSLTGGEPLVRDDLERIASAARDAGLYVHLVTSGIPLRRERLDRLVRAGVDAVQLSIQDADAARGDALAGIAAHARKLAVAGWVRDLGVALTVNVVVHRRNAARVEALVALAEALGADRLELASVQLVGWGLLNRRALLPSRAQVERVRAAASAAAARLRGRMEIVLVAPDWHTGRPVACMEGWGRRTIVVAPDGRVLPCHLASTLPLAFESVRDRPLAEIWGDSPAIASFRSEAALPKRCRGCALRARDHGGCRCQAFHLTGELGAVDPACADAPHHDVVLEARARAEEPAADLVPLVRRAATW